jgi:hypothetical protein
MIESQYIWKNFLLVLLFWVGWMDFGVLLWLDRVGML